MRLTGGIAGTLAALAVIAPAAGAATITVDTPADTVADDGSCSLREAVTATNTNADVNGADDCDHDGGSGPDVIKLPADTIPANGAAAENANASGDFDIEAGAGLVIVGKGEGDSILDGNLDRVIEQESGELTLRKLTVTDGDAGAGHGGGVRDAGTGKLTLDRVTVSASSADLGGGVRVVPGAKLVVTDSTVTGNTATGSQGGGGIHSGAPTTITNSTVAGNTGAGSFGGGGMRLEDPAKITGSTITGNTSVNGGGGGIEVTDGDLTIAKTAITDNHADAHRGGGISYGGDGTLSVSRSVISENSAESGGGGLETVFASDTLRLRRSTVSANSLSSTVFQIIGGGGISTNGESTISDSIIAANTLASPNGMATRWGAGIRNGGQMRIVRSTLSGNKVFGTGFAGGIYQDTGGLTVSNSTLTLNESTDGGALVVAQNVDAKLFHTTLVANVGGGNGDALDVNMGTAALRGSIVRNGPLACSGATSDGFNVDEGASCATGGPHDKPNTDPKLKQFKGYGGTLAGLPPSAVELPVFALRKSSPAVNLVPKRKCKEDLGRLRTDERGFKRPHGKRCDAGAVER